MTRLEGLGVTPTLDEALADGMPNDWTVPEVKDTDGGDGEGGDKGGDDKGTTDETGEDGDGEKGTEKAGATFMTASAAAIAKALSLPTSSKMSSVSLKPMEARTFSEGCKELKFLVTTESG